MAAIPVTPPSSTNNNCTTCSTTRDVVVTFTAANPAPANGYIVKWKTASDSLYTTVSPNATTSPVTIYNVPACENIDVSVESQCAPGFQSQPVTTTVTGLGVPLRCGCGYQGTVDNMNFYIYPSIVLDFTGVQNGSTITLAYNAITRINRFDIYNVTDSTITVTSNWAGSADYPGPWGASNNTSPTGSIQFTYDQTKEYELRVQVGGADPNNQTNDSWDVTLGCNYVPPGPTYYYYEGTLCGDVTTTLFRSTNATLHTQNVVVKALGLNSTQQCFNNIVNNAPVNSNDVIDTYNNCFTCNGGSAFVALTTYYNPCTFVATGGIIDSDVYVANGVTDITIGVQLYNSIGQAITTATLIASSTGEIFDVDNNGVVISSTNQNC